jgi:hypothetical protein
VIQVEHTDARNVNDALSGKEAGCSAGQEFPTFMEPEGSIGSTAERGHRVTDRMAIT